MYDFIVVGAGPAGARFARRSAAAGYDVCVFEHGEIGRPLACSGHVSLDIWEYLPDDARSDLFQNEIYGARFHTGGPETPAERFYKESPVSNAIDRVGLDKRLAEAAERAGATVLENHTVTGVVEHPDHVEVTVSGPDGVETHDALLVAGCDGPRSRVRSECSIPAPDEFLHGVLAFDESPDFDDHVDVHLTIPEFFAWRIPRGEAGVEYGLAVAPGADVAARFDAFCDAYDVSVTHRCSGAIPIGPPSRTIGARSFLLGDAAGQTKPFTGGGILYGMQAADHAAETIDPNDPGTLGAYDRSWREDLATEIRLGHWLRRAYSLPTPVQKLGLSTLSGEIGVHMDRPSTLFSGTQLKALLPGGAE